MNDFKKWCADDIESGMSVNGDKNYIFKEKQLIYNLQFVWQMYCSIFL